MKTAGKAIHTISTTGENINLTWSPDGSLLAVGNKVS
jgi:THO complex subunit 3